MEKRLRKLFEKEQIAARILDLTCKPLDNKDWLAESYAGFDPFSVGPFYIHGSHHSPPEQKDSAYALQIDAVQAFGSGEHATTQICLMAMNDLFEAGACPWNILDMGCGSGILSLAAYKIWKSPVLAIDIETAAIEATLRHAKANHVPVRSDAITAIRGGGFRIPAVIEKKPFDLITANILAGPLIEMAPDMAMVSDENGTLILSGLLTEQRQDVLGAYKKEGFEVISQKELDDWICLILRNTAT